jgi:dolichyl-phosphate-mannose-protein mannosyltransferase
MTIRSESPTVSGTRSYQGQSLGNAVQKLIARLRHWELAWGIALVLFVAAPGVLLTTQGWRSRSPAHDLVPHIINVRNLVTTGKIPIHGDTGSYGSYKPPGTAWLMLPSTLLFSDPRLSEYVGAALLHLATLAGIFLLAYNFFGFWCACLAVVIYGLSSTGILLAASLWPNGRPDFFIWTVYFASQWVIRKDAKYLAIAGTIWGIGMNVDMAILPAIFILPALWLVYRPPIDFKPLIIAIGIVLFVWSPYLRFETGRGFADIRSQVLQQNIVPAIYRQIWCDPSIRLRELGSTSDAIPLVSSQPPQSYQAPNLMSAAVMLTNQITGKFLYNFQGATPFPEMGMAFLVIVLSSFILLSVTGYRPETDGILSPKPFWKPFWNNQTTQLALGMILIGALTNEFIIAHLLGIERNLELSTIKTLRTIEKLLILGGAFVLAGKSMVALVSRLLGWAGIRIQNQERADQMGVLVLSLAIPWFILLMVAEPGKPERFWWLWTLQSTFLAAFFTWILPRFGISRALTWITAISIMIIVGWNPFLLHRVNAWHENGWSGIDAPAIQVVNFVTGEIEAEGKKHAPIGYHFFIYQFMAAYNITNPQYKVGMDFDLLFKYPRGITNTNQCAEGLSPLDEYRIVQTTPQKGKEAPRLYFDVPLDRDFRLLRQFGPYQVFKRSEIAKQVKAKS